jgi:predicted nucleotidyltransferase
VDSGIIGALKKYFRERDDIAFAFLFGSSVKGRVRREGDIDIAVYFWPESDMEWENVTKRYEGENRIALDLEKLLKKEVDLIILNRAKAILADEAIRKGEPIVVKDKGLFLEFLCLISDEAEHMREWIETSYRDRHFETNR